MIKRWIDTNIMNANVLHYVCKVFLQGNTYNIIVSLFPETTLHYYLLIETQERYVNIQ